MTAHGIRCATTIDPERIHLVTSSLFDGLSGAYAGNPVLNAAEFQKSLINHIIVQVQAKHSGKLIMHTHDWMAGGIVTAYAKEWGCPVLHTLHNVHTGHIPMEMFFGIDTGQGVRQALFFHGKWEGVRRLPGDSCQEWPVWSVSWGRGFSGKSWTITSRTSRSLANLRQEVKEKYRHGATLSILNAPSPTVFS